MIGYINSVRDREYKICTPQIFDNLTQSAMVAANIAEYRKGNDACKQLLPAFLFQGYDPNTLLGKKGVRRSSAMLETGFFMMDFDHVEEPMKLFDKFKEMYASAINDGDVALIHITPSGRGLRIVLKKPANTTIEEAQALVEKTMETKMDGVVKDLARLSFCPQAKDILYINREQLFSTPEHKETAKTSLFQQGSADDGETKESGVPDAEHSVQADSKIFPKYHKGIEISKIIAELVEVYGGFPEVGSREVTLFKLVSDMAKITDRSIPWLKAIIPTFGLPEQEWENTIMQVCKKPIERGESKNLLLAISRCKSVDRDGNGKITLDEYEDNFPKKVPALIELLTSRCMPHMKPALAQMCFPALAAHVCNHKFLMDDKGQQELGLMSVLIAPSSRGKSCIDKPIKLIMGDIAKFDKVNRERQRVYNEKNRNRKANEQGEERPKDLIIRYLGGNVTNAGLLQLLTAAEEGDKDNPNQTLYSEVREIQQLYRMASTGGKYGVAELIKAAYDRAPLDAFRATTGAVNAYTPARWNFTAATTPEGATSFFSGKLLVDGTLSRVSFVMMPNLDIPTSLFTLGDYDKEFEKELHFYIKNLNDYKHPVDEEGNAIPLYIPEANKLRRRINALIDIEKYIYPDQDTYESYAFRTRDIVVRQAITTYIANGCKWEDCEDYWMWVYSDQMDVKLTMFGEKAAAGFAAEMPKQGGRQMALKFMPREFTAEEFTIFCQENGREKPKELLRKYKSLKLITEEDGKYIISDEVCQKYGIT